DAEHFFDGYARDAEYAVEVCLSAARAGAAWVVLCDTNGGSLPSAIRGGVEAVGKALKEAGSTARVGIHTHNDCELAVANTLDPALVGNEPRVLISELSGRGNVLAKAREFGLELDRDDPQTRWLVNHLKQLEHQGYAYEAADASFEMLIRRLQPGYVAPWMVA